MPAELWNIADDDDISLAELGASLLRFRGLILAAALVGGLVAGAIALKSPVVFQSAAAFVPQGADGPRSGLASLAGQFGLSVPTGNQAQSPDFYARLLRSRPLLEQVATDTFMIPELNRRVVLTELLEVEGATPQQVAERGTEVLDRLVGISVSKPVGMVEVAATTPWASVSAGIVTRLIAAVNEYNKVTRATQAAAERKFAEQRLQVADSELYAAEHRMELFLKGNVDFGRSPQLRFDHDRLNRDVALRQQVAMTLVQAVEEARLREIRDIPVITILEPPSMPALPEPRHRVRTIVVGILLGGAVGAGIGLALDARRRRRSGQSVSISS